MAVQRERLIRAAEKHVSKGRLEAAIREYRKVLSDQPDDVGTLNRLGDLYARIEHTDEAVELFERIAESYTNDGFFVKAIAIYKKIIKLDPTRLEIYERLAELYHKQGLVNEARTQYQVLADYYLKHDNATSAVTIYQKMVELEPKNPSHHAKLAELYQDQGFLAKAIAEYRTIAGLMLDAGHPQEASQVYARALDVDAQDLDFITEAARKLHEFDYTAEAARFLIRATELNPQARQVAAAIGLTPPEAETQPEPRETPSPEPEAVEAPPPAVEPAEKRPTEAEAGAAAPEPEPAPEPAEELPAEDEMVLDLDEGMADMDAALEEAQGAVEARAEATPEPPEPMDATQTGEIELDLDDVFELEMEEDEEPSPSQVQPPSDMVEGQVGRAFLREEEKEAPGEMDAVMETGFDLEEPEVAEPEAKEEEEEDTATTEPMWMEEPEAAPTEEPTGTGVTDVEADFLERTAAELHPPESPAPDADNLVAEAEVLVKYEMDEKAAEKLSEALQLDAEHLGAHALLLEIEATEGDASAIRSRATRLRELAEAQERPEVWEQARENLTELGVELGEETQVSAPEPEPQPFTLEEDETEEPSPPTAAAPREPEPPTAPRRRPVRPKSDARVQRLLDELVADVAPRRRRKTRPSAPPTQGEAAASAETPEAAPPPEAGHPLPAEPDDLTLHGIFDEVEVEEGPSPFVAPSEAAPPEAAESPGAAEAEAVFDPERDLDRSPVEMLEEDSGVRWLDEVESADATPEAVEPAGAEIYEDEDDFFDLAAELEQELSDEEIFGGESDEDLAAAPQEQSLEEIVAGFKKGVSESLSAEDYDTHFNLGIAYREMGLLDEAIGEFQVAAKSRAHLVECCSMLGLSFLEKGLPELAAKWYQRGLQTPDLTEEDTLGLLYDMGNAYLAAGDEESAQKTFVEAYGINSNYRDVVAKLEELRS